MRRWLLVIGLALGLSSGVANAGGPANCPKGTSCTKTNKDGTCIDWVCYEPTSKEKKAEAERAKKCKEGVERKGWDTNCR